MRSQLLQAKSDTLLLVVEVEDNHVDLLIELNDLLRMRNTAPREVSDVDQTIYATEVDEYTVRGDVLNRTLQDLALLQLRDNIFLLLLQLSLDEGLM